MEPFCEIDAEEFEAAQRDPKVQALLREAKEYTRFLIEERGHCPCHVVINCPHVYG